ncbi:MAG: hypothetical protein R3F62_10215 [Planctomycetota bacterium]
MEVWNEVGLLMLWLGGIGAGLLSILYLEELWATRRPRFARVDPRRTRLLGAWHRWARESPFLAALIAGPFVLAGLAALGIVGAWATVGLSELRLSDDGDVVVIYWSGEISSNDPFPASSIASNNLAPDGGGLSPNNVHLVDVRVLWSADDPASDGEDAAVGDALVLFTTTDGAAFTLWGAHFDGCCFTPPAQLRCLERDPLQPVRLEGFGALTVPGRSGSRWVLLGDVATRGRTGHALAHWAFRSDVRNRGRTTDPRPSTGAGAYEHGFAVDAEVLAGEAVTSYGLVSDGLSGFARYASSIEPAASASPLDPPTQARVPGAAHASRGEAASFASALYTVTDGRLLTRRLDLATLGFDPPQVVATLEPDVVWRPGIAALDGWAFVGTARAAGPRAEGLVALHVPSGAQRVLRPTLPGQVQVDPVDPWAFGADQGLRETVALWAAEEAEGAAGLYAARLDDDGAFAPGG